MTPLDTLLLARHPWLAGMAPEYVRRLAEVARDVNLRAGERVFAEGQIADRFWLIRDGRITLHLDLPGRGTVLIETLGAGDVLGWSWLFAPYRWRFGATAVERTRGVEIHAPAIRQWCDTDPTFCADIYRRVSAVTVDRLQATRLRLLDLYGNSGGA